MTYQDKVLSLALLVAMSVSAGNLAAETGKGVPAQNLYSGAAEEVARDGQQLQNSGEQDQLRQRLNEQDRENARKARFENQLKEKHEYQYQYQNKTQAGRLEMNRSGSMQQMRPGKGGGPR